MNSALSVWGCAGRRSSHVASKATGNNLDKDSRGIFREQKADTDQPTPTAIYDFTT
jgi:hypothetical protein